MRSWWSIVACVAGPVAAQTCQPFWSGLVYDNPTIHATLRLVNIDDGQGLTIYTSVVETSVLDLARWSRDH